MSQTIKLPNFNSLNNRNSEKTRLAGDTVVGATSLTVQNNNGIVPNLFLLIGLEGAEKSEIRAVSAATGATLITTLALSFEHFYNDPVTVLFGNQIKVYRAPNVDGNKPADNAFLYLATVDIEADQGTTTYTDPSGSSAWWYKSTYFNSLLTLETSLADTIAVRGGGFGNYVSIDAIRQEAGFKNNVNVTDSLIDEKRQTAQDEVNSSLYGVYAVPFAAPNGIIKNITLMIAVMYLHVAKFGAYDEDSAVGRKIDMALNQLERLKSGQLVLVNPDGSSMQIPDGGGGEGGISDNGMSGWPNRTTASLPAGTFGAGGPMFNRSSIDGFETRVY